MSEAVTIGGIKYTDEELSNGYYINRGSINVLQHTIGDTPYDVKQLTFEDEADTVERSTSWIRSRTEELFLGFKTDIGRNKNLLSTKIDYYGSNYHTIYNDTFNEYDSSKGTQVTGYVREQIDRKITYIGQLLNPTLMTGEFDGHGFVPEYWHAYNDDGSKPALTVPLAPKEGSSYLVMMEDGQKYYMSVSGHSLIETKGFRVNVGDALESTGDYDWETNKAPIIDDYLVDTLPEEGKIVFSNAEGEQVLTLDSTEISVVSGTSRIVIKKDGNIEIYSNGNNIELNGSTNIIIASTDQVKLAAPSGTTGQMALSGVVGTAGPWPFAPAVMVTSSVITNTNLTGQITLQGSQRKVKTS